VVVKDLRVDDDRSGPIEGLLFALNMALYTEAGDVYSTSQLRDWLAAAGLGDIADHRLAAAPPALLLLGRPPGGPAGRRGGGVRRVAWWRGAAGRRRGGAAGGGDRAAAGVHWGDMARVFLINPPSPEPVRTPLLSFCHLAAALRAGGHEVALLDASAPHAPHTADEIGARVRSFGADLVGLHLKTLHVQPAYALAEALPDLPLV